MTDPLPIVRTVRDLRARISTWRQAGQSIAIAPTMGALHDGHLSLIRTAHAHADRVVASIFVNPTQFAPSEDFDAYPRNEARDASMLAGAGCDLLYAPAVAEMYPTGFSTRITVSGVSAPLDGLARPEHFAGVATVVAKLLIQCGPDVAVFGEKDYQQLLIIRRLAADLDLPVEIIAAPTARLADGLAMSSRNAYLNAEQRAIAGRLNVVLAQTAAALRKGASPETVEQSGRAALLAHGFDSIDYLEVRSADDLAPAAGLPPGAPLRVFAAARLGRTRLIDNMAV